MHNNMIWLNLSLWNEINIMRTHLERKIGFEKLNNPSGFGFAVLHILFSLRINNFLLPACSNDFAETPARQESLLIILDRIVN